MAMSFQTSWDDYVSKTNAVYASWNDLNTKRAALQAPWFEYVDKANEWLNWSDDVEKAQNEWEDAVKQCVADASKAGVDDDGVSSGGFGSSNGGNADSDEDEKNETGMSASQIQKQCEAANPKPDILDEEKPDKPTAPAMPDGVTLPSTWPADPLQ